MLPLCSGWRWRQHDLNCWYLTTIPHSIKTPEMGGSEVVQNAGILSHHYVASEPRRWRQHGPPKCWYPITPHGFKTQKMGGSTVLWNEGILPRHHTASQPRRWRQHGPLNQWYATTSLYGIITWIKEAARSSKMLVSYHITTQFHNPEDHELNLHCCENLKFLIVEFKNVTL